MLASSNASFYFQYFLIYMHDEVHAVEISSSAVNTQLLLHITLYAFSTQRVGEIIMLVYICMGKLTGRIHCNPSYLIYTFSACYPLIDILHKYNVCLVQVTSSCNLRFVHNLDNSSDNSCMHTYRWR